jgi:hypothetical protein
MSYFESAADIAFTIFLATIIPADFSATEYALFTYHKLRATS